MVGQVIGTSPMHCFRALSQAADHHGWCPTGEVIKPDSWKCINDEGMPVHGRPFEKGNLYIRFLVQFPDTLSEQQVAALQQILPKPAQQQQSAMDSDDIEQVGDGRACDSCTCGCLPVMILEEAVQVPALSSL